jgi:Protein of unknown function (DUF3341)
MSGDRAGPALIGEFATADAMLAALTRLRDEGYVTLRTFGPFDLPEVDRRLRPRRSRLPWWVFGGGLVGAVASYWIQWYANAWDYPLDVGGRPAHALPAFILATFEGTVLLAALTAFVGFLAILRLPRLWHPAFELDGFERATVDHFWIGVGGLQSDIDAQHGQRALEASGALRVVRTEDDLW